MASGRLMSLVGEGSTSKWLPMPRTSNRLHVKMKMNRVRASGTTLAPRGPMESSTCFWTAPTAISHSSWNLPGTPLVTFTRIISPTRMTITPAMIVAHTVSMSMVSPKTWRWTWSPTEMSASRGTLSRCVPMPTVSGTSPVVVRRVDGGAGASLLGVVLDHVDADHVVPPGHRTRLGHRAGHIGQQDHLEHGQPAEDAEPEAGRDEQQTDDDHGDDPHPAEGVERQGAPLVLLVAGRDPGHRVADHPEVERAERQADAGPHPEQQVPEGDAADQGGDADHQGRRHRPAGDGGYVRQGEVGEHVGYRAPSAAVAPGREARVTGTCAHASRSAVRRPPRRRPARPIGRAH